MPENRTMSTFQGILEEIASYAATAPTLESLQN
jgi:hypothetical protein